MKISKDSVMEEAVKVLAETGILDLPTRRKLWEAMGPLEPREQDSSVPRALTEPLKKRAELALSCAKKVSRIWCTYDPEDKRPQNLIKQTRAYLDGKISVEMLNTESDVIEDFMSIVDDDGSDSAPAAAIAAWNALVVAMEDEQLLEPWYVDTTDADLDAYDWDAAKNAVAVWRDAGTDGDRGKQAIREMKFWAWYLEEAAKLMGLEDFRFPPKYIKAFAEKQAPPRLVPKEVTLESFAEYIGGKYCYHTYCQPYDGRFDNDAGSYIVKIWIDGDYGVCPECHKITTEVRKIARDCCLQGIPLSKNRKLKVIRVMPFYRCPDHPEVSWILPNSSRQISSYKEAFKRYIKGSGRMQAFLKQLESRLPNSLHILGAMISCNGWSLSLKGLERYKEELNLTDAEWVDRKLESYVFDVGQFLPHLYIQDCTFEDFLNQYPERVRTLEDDSVELEVYRFWARFWLDETGKPSRVMLTTRCFIWIKPESLKSRVLPGLLMELRGLTAEQAEKDIQTAKLCFGEYELDSLSGLTRPEAIRLETALKAKGVNCRILP